MSGKGSIYLIRSRPKRYKILPQQRVFIDALDFCEIKKGISKSELQKKMKSCIPKYIKEHKNDYKDIHVEEL
jgi:hypothetical protein